MRLGLAHGPLLLLLYQAAPLAAGRDSLGRYRLSIGYGVARFEEDQFDCAGNVTAATPVAWRTGGGQLDAWPSPRLRVSAFIGVVHSDSLDYDGLSLGALVAAENQHVGIGGGLVRVPGRYSGITGPAFYLRLGSIDGAHFRFDALTPSSTFGATGWARLGVGFNQGHLSGVSGFVGLSGCPYCDQKINVGLFGDFTIPAGTRVDLVLRGRVGPGQRLGERGTGLGVRYNFGR